MLARIYRPAKNAMQSGKAKTKDEAVAYAQAHGIAFQISDPKPAKRIIKAYADNFAFGRKQPWTH